MTGQPRLPAGREPMGEVDDKLPIAGGHMSKVVDEATRPVRLLARVPESAGEGKVGVFKLVAIGIDRDQDSGLHQRLQESTSEVAVVGLALFSHAVISRPTYCAVGRVMCGKTAAAAKLRAWPA